MRFQPTGLMVCFATCFCVALGAAVGASAEPAFDGDHVRDGPVQAGKSAAMTMDSFLDRLMVAESGGRDLARNPRSSALGPFQFIVSTFVDVAQRHFPDKADKLSRAQLLALRTDRAFARKAAEAYTRDNAALLATAGHKPTFPNLRLAFLLGAGGAMRVLSAPSKTPLSRLLRPAAIRANPFMRRMTASDLIQRAARDIAIDPNTNAGVDPGKLVKRRRRGPEIRVRCNLARPSCRRWLALKKRRMARAARRASAK